MTFDEGLREELKSIVNLNKRVYPIVAPEGIKPPFVVYRKSRSKYSKDLAGIITDVEGTYEIIVICDDYKTLDILIEEIKKKLIKVLFRRIGETGPIINNLELEDLGNEYIYQPNAYKNSLLLNISYKLETAFSKVFKETVGLTPKEYRDSLV